MASALGFIGNLLILRDAGDSDRLVSEVERSRLHIKSVNADQSNLRIVRDIQNLQSQETASAASSDAGAGWSAAESTGRGRWKGAACFRRRTGCW
jgi:hypothetical protein